MGMMKLLGWKAEAEVLGSIYTVEYDDRKLVIHDVAMDFAEEILNAIATKQLYAVKLPGVKKQEAIEPQAAPPVEPKVTRPEPSPQPEVKKASSVAETKQNTWDPAKEFAAGELTPAIVAQKPIQAAPEVELAKLDTSEPPAALASTAPAKPQIEGLAVNLPQHVQNAPNVISVLNWLIEEKKLAKNDVEKIVLAAQELQMHVGILRRMGAKLPDRVRSTMSMYAEGGGL